MQIITPFDPSATTTGTITTGLVNTCAVLYLINESPIGLKLLFADGSQAVLPPWFARAYKLRVANAPVSWQQLYTLGVTGSPVSVIQGEGYEPNEADLSQLSQGPLTRQINVGNTVTTTSSSGPIVTANLLQNDGNPTSTQIIESTPSGDTVSSINVTNDGTFILGNIGRPGHINSDNFLFKTDGSGGITANNLTLNGTLSVGGNTILSGGATVGGHSVPKISTFTGTMTSSPLTFNHNFPGGSPAWIGIMNTTSGGGNLFKITTQASTTVTIASNTTGAGITFLGIAIG